MEVTKIKNNILGNEEIFLSISKSELLHLCLAFEAEIARDYPRRKEYDNLFPDRFLKKIPKTESIIRLNNTQRRFTNLFLLSNIKIELVGKKYSILVRDNIKLKNKDITFGEITSLNRYVGGSKYFILNDATYEGNTFKEGIKCSWVCPDEGDEFVGDIERISIDDFGNVEVSLDSPIGRVDLDELTIIQP